MARYHGRKGQVYISSTGTGTATAFASLSSWSLDSKTDKTEVTAFGDSNKTYVQGLPDVQGQFEGFFDNSNYATLTAAAASADGIKVYLYPDAANAPTFYHYGPAFLDYSLNGSVGDAVKISASFAAAGSWGNKP